MTDSTSAPLGRRSARAILIDESGRILLIKRTKPGQLPYWTTPGGGVEEVDLTIEAALHRELTEELGAKAFGATEVFVHSSPTQAGQSVQHFFLARLASLNAEARNGPELNDPSRGEYVLDRVDLDDLETVDLKPSALKSFIMANRDALLAEVARLA